MITSMREYFRGLKFILLIVIVAFIATSVVYFGASSVDGPSGTAVASVNGEEIPLDRYRRAYSSYVDFYRQLYRERFTQDLLERLGLPGQVMEELVQDALVVQESRSQGITVSDEELRRRIQMVPAFQQDGQFSRDRYLAVLRQVRLDPGVFEAEQRRDIQRRKLESLVRGGVKVSDAEVRQAWVARHEQVRMAWARVDPQALAAEVKVAEDQAEAWLKSHQAQFTRPERRRILYALVASSAFAEPVPDAAAEAYYREHPAEFEAPRRVRAAHVLVRVPPTGGSDAESKARAKVEEIIRRAKAGEDFAKLAREASQDQATAGQGGDLGFMKAGDMVKPFEDAAFALRKGEVSAAPVRTSFGYHAIKALDVQEGGREPFKDVASRIKQRLLAEQSEKAARKRAEEVRPPLLAAPDFKADARKLGLEVREVAVARGDGLEGIGRDPAFEEVVFGLAPGGVSLPVKTSAGFAIVKAVETLAAGVPPLAEIKTDVLEAMRREAADKLAASRAAALIAAVTASGDLVKVARSQGLTGGETPFFSQAEPPKGASADLPGAALVAAFQTPVGRVSRAVDTPAGVYVVKPLERRPPDPSGFEAAREDLARALLDQKRARVWEVFLRGLQGKAKIEMARAATGLPGR